MLKPQDILLVLKLIALGERSDRSYAELALEVGLSSSEAHAGLQRAVVGGLAEKKADQVRPIRQALEEFLLHGVRYAFPPSRGGMTRGMPTAGAAPPLEELLAPSEEPPPVWPDPSGEVRGLEFSPLYRSAPVAARNDPKLYELLALVDALRGGGARERRLAEQQLRKRLYHD